MLKKAYIVPNSALKVYGGTFIVSLPKKLKLTYNLPSDDELRILIEHYKQKKPHSIWNRAYYTYHLFFSFFTGSSSL